MLGLMSGGGDEIDRTGLARFAWRFVKPGESVDLSEAPPAAPPALPAASTLPAPPEAPSAEGRAECRSLANEIARVWAVVDQAAQARATAKLARRAARMGAMLAAGEGPEFVRLARLFVRHFAHLPRAARKNAENACLWLDLQHPETNELILELVRSGNERLDAALSIDPERMESFAPDLSLKLAIALDEAKTWSSCVLAVDWLRVFGERDAVPAVRRALRRPHMGLRERAIQFLLELSPPALVEADVQALLEDGVDHGAPYSFTDDSDEVASGYATALLEAVAAVRPAEGKDLLLAMLENDEDLEPNALDETWALTALAAAYPEEGARAIDEQLESGRAFDREFALWAVAKLPIELARPRLLHAAADGSFRVARAARDQWLEREGRPCPVAEMAGVPLSLLREAPPSDRMRTRLIVLRSPSAPARHAMLEVLLREAPDPEALTLLVFAMGDDRAADETTRQSLPRDAKGWATAMVRGWGALAVEGLCALAERYPRGSAGPGWLGIAAQLLDEGTIRREDAAPLRDLAARRVASETWEGDADSPRILAGVGAPAELLERLWALTFSEEIDSFALVRVRDVLSRWPAEPSLDARLLHEASAGLDERDFDRFYSAASIAFSRRIPGAVDVALRALSLADDPEAEWVAVQGGRALIEEGRLPPGWIEEGLGRPETQRFSVAARLVSRTMPPEHRAVLEAALSSRARGGATAVDAAERLLWGTETPIRPTDRRLVAILAWASPKPCARLITTLIAARGRAKSLEPHIIRVLDSADPEAIDVLRDGLWGEFPDEALLRRLAPRITDADVRAEVEEIIAPPAEPFWQDGA